MKPLIILDPGHGTPDSGATGNGTTEAEQNLAVSLTLKNQLEQAGFEVRLTRTGPAWPGGAVSKNSSFFYRCNPATLQCTNQEPFAFISVHHDMATARGGGVYYHPGRQRSLWLAQAITKITGGWCRPDTACRFGSLYVVRNSPSSRGVLWEVGPVKPHSLAERIALCAPVVTVLTDIRDRLEKA